MQARLLVTGGAGFIGANFVHYWLSRHPEARLVVVDALTYAGNLANLEDARDRAGFRFVHGDIRDRQAMRRLLVDERIDTIVHFAAESHVDRSIAGPEVFVDVNIGGTQSLLEAARSVWIDGSRAVEGCRFHHVSTDEVYGSLAPDEPPFTESSPYAPSSPYAASKAGADHLVRAYQQTYGLPVSLSNCSNNYGPFHFPEKLIPLCIVNLLLGRPLPVYGDGLQVRDWLHVTDHCRGIASILERGGLGVTYNIGGNCERANIDVVRTICRRMDARFAGAEALAERFPDCPAAAGVECASAITSVRDRPGHDRRYAIDAGRIAAELGFEPRVSFDDGLAATIDWYLEHEGWWRGVMDESYRSWIDRWYDD